jgi:Zn-dependent peptidase ImmA (M78 family)
MIIVKLPRLHLQNIERWFQRRGLAYQFGCNDRAVRGCLLAYRGKGIIFVDGTDPDDELRYTLAHEVAHYLVDYLSPRELALERFGDSIREVLDGSRIPSTDEKIQAFLSRTKLGIYTDLMERDTRSDDISNTLWSIEDRADRIALTLLAPQAEVLDLVDLRTPAYKQREIAIIETLTAHFGLPESIAVSYGRALLRNTNRGRSWLESIGLR